MPADRASTGPESAQDRASEVTRRLGPETRFREVSWLSETGSTNSDVMALARNGAGEGTVVVADFQHGGRGRQGRQWLAPPSRALLVSALLRPPAPLVGPMSLLVGVAMAEAVEELTAVAPRLKWPNDLLVEVPGIGERKLAGILCEADWPPGTTASGGWRQPSSSERLPVVAGVGVNIDWPRRHDGSLPPDVADRATSLNDVTGDRVDRLELLVGFLQRLDARYAAMVRHASAREVLDAWRKRSSTLGRPVRVDLGTEDVEGTAVDITQEGHLVVETLGDRRRTFAVGDVIHLR